MYLKTLTLTGVRNHLNTTLELNKGITVIQGLNAQGKTNIIEAIFFLSLGRSHRTNNLLALINADLLQQQGAAIVRAEAVRDHGEPVVVAAELKQGRNRISVQNNIMKRFADGIGHIRAVLLAPEDLNLVRGEPKIRRTYMDDTLSVRRPQYALTLREATQSLKQRNAMLRDETLFNEAVFKEYTETWLNHASHIMAARIALVHAIQKHITDIYTTLIKDSPTHDIPRLPQLSYAIKNGETIAGKPDAPLPDVGEVRAMLQQLLAQTAQVERIRRVTLVGPQRDDLDICLQTFPAKDFASHGEQWSLSLGLKLSAGLIIAETGDMPILLLDDVFADLDTPRRQRLLEQCHMFDQVLITSAGKLDVMAGYRHITIKNGGIIDDQSKP